MSMEREIKWLVIHCSATRPSVDFTKAKLVTTILTAVATVFGVQSCNI